MEMWSIMKPHIVPCNSQPISKPIFVWRRRAGKRKPHDVLGVGRDGRWVGRHRDAASYERRLFFTEADGECHVERIR